LSIAFAFDLTPPMVNAFAVCACGRPIESAETVLPENASVEALV
jgi:hypothetical protein